ncbi:MAG: GNAT family N-acetyltransferase [Caldilineaceae bacterium]|nr:GNAT family N-acetyltransferase [Caldilineaceae bacterium]
MHDGYFNYYTRFVESWWQRRDFVRGWHRLHASDRRWVPPYHPALMAALTPGRTPHLDRQQPSLFWVEALPGSPNTDGKFNAQRINSAFMEEAVATAALLVDPRRRDGTATLAMLSVANDVESLERLLSIAQEQAFARGRSRLVGPVAFSPYLGYGALLDHFDQTPPLYTPYNAPYLPEILDAVFERGQTARLYHAPVHSNPKTSPGPAFLRPLRPEDDATVLPNLLAALDGAAEFPSPDATEVAFLLAWWSIVPSLGWIAEVEQQPVGFVLLQPDLAPALRRAKGGRNLLWRLWWQWRRTQPARSGRIVAGCVLPQWRRQGIGSQLWGAALASAHLQGWRNLSVGPVADDAAAAAFLLAHDAQPRQRYALYGTE